MGGMIWPVACNNSDDNGDANDGKTSYPLVVLPIF